MALLKWVLKMCRQKKRHPTRPNTGYMAVVSTRDNDELRKSESMFENEHISGRTSSAAAHHDTADDHDDLNNDNDAAKEPTAVLDSDDVVNDCDVDRKLSLSTETGAQETATDETKDEVQENNNQENIQDRENNNQDVERNEETHEAEKADPDAFADLVPSEGHFRVSSRAESHFEGIVPGEDEDDDAADTDAAADEAEREETENRCE